MKHSPTRTLILFSFIALTGLFFASFKTGSRSTDKNFCFNIVRDMTDSIAKIKTLRCHIKAMERVNGKYLSAESDIKFESLPRKLYFKNPTKKLEILYLDGLHGNNALVKPNSLPTSIYLDPYGSMMRKNQHYTINELGFIFISRTMKSIMVKDGEKLAKNLSYHGIVNKKGENCHMIMYENKEFGYTDYTVGKNESVATIAIKHSLSDYMIRSKNSLHSYYGAIKQGTVIKIPNNYCAKATLFISEKTKMPVAINIYDEVDLWESYEHSNIILNKPIDAAEFTRGFKDYNF